MMLSTNLRYADDIILLATSEAELQELVDRLDRVSRKYSLLINADVMDMSSYRPMGASVARLIILISGARSRSWN